MNRKTFDECFNWLEKYSGKRGAITAAYRDKYYEKFAAEHDDVFIEGVNISAAKLAPGLFPTTDRMVGFVAEAREKLWQKVKDAEPKKPLTHLAQSKAPRSEYAAEILRATIDMLEHKRDPIKTFLELDKKYPGKGWERAAYDQVQHKKRMTETPLPDFLPKRLDREGVAK